MTISEKAFSLYAALKAAFSDKGFLCLKYRFLFALTQKPLSPKNLSAVLSQDKTNLAHLAKKLQEEGLIQKLTVKSDNRAVRYSLTETGRETIQSLFDENEKRFLCFLDSPEAVEAAKDKIDEVVYLLSFL